MRTFTRTVTETFEVAWVHREFTRHATTRTRVRDGLSHGHLKDDHQCFKCGRQFGDGEWMALASLKDVGNKVFCEACAKELEEPF